MIPYPAEPCGSDIKFYKFFRQHEGSWEEVRDSCAADDNAFISQGRHQGRFASIRSEADQRMLEQVGFGETALIGGYRDTAARAGSQHWKWVGENTDERDVFWYEGLPDSGVTVYLEVPGVYTNWAVSTSDPNSPLFQTWNDILLISPPNNRASGSTAADVFKWTPDPDFSMGNPNGDPVYRSYVCEYCVGDHRSTGGMVEIEVPSVGIRTVWCDRLGRVLIQRATRNHWVYGECTGYSSGAPIDDAVTVDSCGYLAEATVRAVAQHATAVTLVSHEHGSVTSTSAQEGQTHAAVEALRSGGNWHTQQIVDEWAKLDDLSHSFSQEWQWGDPTSGCPNDASGWPHMYYSCDNHTVVHWSSFDGEPHASLGFPHWDSTDTSDDKWVQHEDSTQRYTTYFDASETWLVMRYGFCPCAPLPCSSEPTPEPTSEPTGAPGPNPTSPSPLVIADNATTSDGFNPLWLLLLLVLLPIIGIAACLVLKNRQAEGKTKTETFAQADKVDDLLTLDTAERPKETQPEGQATDDEGQPAEAAADAGDVDFMDL